MGNYKYRNNKHNSKNYVKVLELLTPNFYVDEEIAVSGVEPELFDRITHSLIGICNDSSKLFGVGSLANTPIPGLMSSDLHNPSGMAKFFIKQNKLTDFDLVDFDTHILAPQGY